MQVNPTSLISLSLQNISAGERSVEKMEIAGQAAADTGIKPQDVDINFAKLEQAMLQWFFEQRPELGEAMAKLLALQNQLSNLSTSNMADQSAEVNDKIEKMNNLLNSLVISPGGIAEEKTTTLGKTMQNLLALLEEFEQLKNDQSSAVQRKIDDVVTKLTVLFKQLKPGPNLPGDAGTSGAVAGKNAAESKMVGVAAEGEAELSVASSKPTVPPHEGNMPTTATQDMDLMEHNTGLPKITDIVKAGEIQETPAEIVKTANNESPSSSSAVQAGWERVEDTGPQNCLSAKTLNTAEKIPGQLQNNAVDVRKKIIEILQQVTESFAEHASSEKLRNLLQDMAACATALQVNPEAEWESLLRYPVIYKQTLSKALKLLQELSNTKFSDGIQRDVVGLMQEITANIHVQNAVNQLRQENPAQQTIYFQIPLQIGNDIRNGEILVVHQREKHGQKWDIASSWYRFYLETQFLGPVQINLQVAQKQLSIHFVVTGTEQSELLEQQKTQLSRILTHYGYEVADITCDVSTITPLFMLDTDSTDRQCVDITI